jgi:type I restriction enzyme S subunit
MAARVGGAQPNISQGILRDINVPLPLLRIQKQIASILEKADAAREKRRQANQLTERFLQSAFLEMFGDPVTNPKGWDKKSIAEFGSVVTGSTPSKIVADYYSERDFNFFKPDDIGDGVTLLKSSRDFLTRSGSEQARICPVGSVLTTCIGIIGKVGILQEDSCFNQQINSA